MQNITTACSQLYVNEIPRLFHDQNENFLDHTHVYFIMSEIKLAVFAKCAERSDLMGDNRVGPIQFIRTSDQVSETKIQEIMKKC